jgi:membrane-associated protein
MKMQLQKKWRNNFNCMELLEIIKALLTDIDGTLAVWVKDYGTWIYAILFLIVFVETGLIVMPFLPGDSLLFTAGMLAAQGANEHFSIYVFIPLLIGAALLGDNVNYFVGRFFSDQIKKRDRILFFKKEYIDSTEAFFVKHGKQSIIMARFVPIVRTVAPFVAGAGSMPYRTYILYCVIGAIIWVTSISFLGYFLGNIPIIKDNFEKVVLGIVGISVLPIFWQMAKSWLAKRRAA